MDRATRTRARPHTGTAALMDVTEMVGSGAHWRVVREPSDVPLWRVWRRHWDRWDPVMGLYPSQHMAMSAAYKMSVRDA